MLGALLLLLAQPLSAEALKESLTKGGSSNYQPVVAYDLQVAVHPTEHSALAKGTVRWTNATSKPVRELWWHLYLNAFKNDRSSFMLETGGGELRGKKFDKKNWGYVEVTRLVAKPPVPGPDADLLIARAFEHPDDDNLDDRTVMRTPLPFEVGPGQSLDLEIEFESRLPKDFARAGYSGTFNLFGQWFPKLGVLEESGWNCHQYHATTEFYADYGAFKVAIDVPKDQVVGATGVLLEKKEHGDRVTYVYAEGQIHDFAFVVDSRLIEVEQTFDAKKALLDPDTKKAAAELGLLPEDLQLSDVKVRLLVQPEHTDFTERYLASVMHGLGWLGRRYGAYPYSTLTVVDGPRGADGAMGMEYPTFITGGVRWPAPKDGPSPEAVTIHELAHQWWYGMAGSNEFEEAWLDEGFTTFTSGLAFDAAYGPFIPVPWWLHPWLGGHRIRAQDTWRIGTMMSPDRDAITQKGWQFRDQTSYAMASYPRTAAVLDELGKEIGPAALTRALRLYQLRFRFRHPHGADFEKAVEEVTGRSMSGFFEMMKEPVGLDYAITELTSQGERTGVGLFDDLGAPAGTFKHVTVRTSSTSTVAFRTRVFVERKGELVRPVTLEVQFAGGQVERRTWDGVYRWARFDFETKARAEVARIDPDRRRAFDLERSNDARKIEPSLKPGAVLGSYAGYWIQTLWQILGAML